MFNKLLNVKFVIVESILLTDFSDRISRSMRTGYDVEKTEYEMVKRTQKVLNTVNELLFTCEKFPLGLRGPRSCEYFFLQTSCISWINKA